MQIKGLILGGAGNIVKNGNTLKAMARRGHFKYPVDDSKNPYVDELNNPRVFEYNKNTYRIEYRSGCFFPIVITV